MLNYAESKIIFSSESNKSIWVYMFQLYHHLPMHLRHRQSLCKKQKIKNGTHFIQDLKYLHYNKRTVRRELQRTVYKVVIVNLKEI